MQPVFSVIIPLYNKENFVQQTLDSVLRQSFSDFEIIIVNDGSTDRSEEKALEVQDSRIRYYKKENGGASTARNLGISLSQGKFVAFLDADDYWYPNFLEEIYKYTCLLPDEKVFATAIEFEYQGKISKAVYSIQKTADYEIVNYFEASYHESVLFTSASVFDKTIFSETGVFDPTIKSGQDTDLWIRIGLKYKVVFIWRVGVRYIYDTQSLSRNISNLKEKANYSRYEELESTNKPLKKFIDYNRFSLAIKSRLYNDRESFHYFKSKIDLKNLPFRKRVLLSLPSWILNSSIWIKNGLMKLGITHSVFVK